VKSAYSDLAKAIALDRIGMAKAAGAKVIVTSCPWCEQNLKECQGENAEVQVVDLAEIVERSQGSCPKKGSRRSG
jgi:Fe-S oxidoreductase